MTRGESDRKRYAVGEKGVGMGVEVGVSVDVEVEVGVKVEVGVEAEGRAPHEKEG